MRNKPENWERWIETATQKFLRGVDWTSQHTLEKLGAPLRDEEKAREYVTETRVLLSRTTQRDMFKGKNSSKKREFKPISTKGGIFRLVMLPIWFLTNTGPFRNKQVEKEE